MKAKIWSYLATGFFFMSIGIIIGAKWIAGDDYSVEIKKIKNKRTSGTTTTNVPVNMEVPEKKPRGRQRRREKKR